MYKLKEDLEVRIDTFINYKSLDGILSVNGGKVVIKKGFEWDGMTGWRDVEASRNGSCLHDALYRYYFVDNSFPFTRTECDKFLIDQLSKNGAYSTLERILIYIGLRTFGRFRGLKSTAIVLESTAVKQGVVFTVYNKNKKFGENKFHYWILTKLENEEQWIRLTKNQYKSASQYPSRNIEDIPKIITGD